MNEPAGKVSEALVAGPLSPLNPWAPSVPATTLIWLPATPGVVTLRMTWLTASQKYRLPAVSIERPLGSFKATVRAPPLATGPLTGGYAPVQTPPTCEMEPATV